MNKILSHKAYTQYLEQVTELFQRHLELLKEDENSKTWAHKLIELRADMNHLRSNVAEDMGNEEENKKSFLEHHRQATEQALDLRMHILHHLDSLICHELELGTLRHELEAILCAVEAHKQAHLNYEQPTPFRSFYGPSISPLPLHKKNDECI